MQTILLYYMTEIFVYLLLETSQTAYGNVALKQFELPNKI